ncbi:MAG: hypothetical protein NWR30_11880 [Salibacteraceae bacterium]|nr:hypothetical protein [Salibacteraceae bacterium]
MKLNISVVAFLFITFGIVSCDKTDGLKRKVGGKYDISLTENEYRARFNCGDTSKIIYSVLNPGRMVFTNDKVIQGPANTLTYRPYVGYFEYDFTLVDYFGQAIVYSDKTYFPYDFPTLENGDSNWVEPFIYMEGQRMELIIEEDDKGNPVSFSYKNYNDNCYWGYITHYVK